MVSVILPWRPQPSRLPAFAAVGAWYAAHLPEAEVRIVDSGDVPFNLARCRNTGVTDIDDLDEVVVIGDADTLPEEAPLRAAIDAARTSGRVHLPYDAYHWLGRSGTQQFANGTPLAECDFELVRGACSGVYVTTPRTWQSHGGQDERFRGWGFEDAAWYLAHGTLLGEPPRRHGGAVYALHHAAEVRAGAYYDANAALMERYRSAADDRGAMAQVVFGETPDAAAAAGDSANRAS